MKIQNITNTNIHIYKNLAQAYEAEFSSITDKKPDKDGLFELDTPIDESHIGYLGYLNNEIVGFGNIGIKPESCFEVCEYYILPVYRKKDLGTQLIHEIWLRHTGKWEIKQIVGAEYATAFWRKAISRYKNTIYEENIYIDPYWGKVTRQLFKIK